MLLVLVLPLAKMRYGSRAWRMSRALAALESATMENFLRRRPVGGRLGENVSVWLPIWRPSTVAQEASASHWMEVRCWDLRPGRIREWDKRESETERERERV